MSQDTALSITRSAKSSFLGTLLSRFGGMGRDVIMAFFFGSSPHIAAFMVAFRVANLFRRLLGEGTLPSGFIPHFEHLRATDPKKSAYFYRDLLFSFSLFLVGIIALGEIVLFAFFHFSISPQVKEILSYVMLMLPGLLFVCLYALSSSFLQCYKNYFLPASAPVIFNILWIGIVLSCHRLMPQVAIRVLSVGVVVAFFFQWLVTFGPSFRYLTEHLSFKEWFRPSWFSRELQCLIKPISLSVIGVGAMQINSALDAFFARAAISEGPAFLWYAMRFYQLPLALFGIALAGAILPPLSRAFKEGNLLSFTSFLQHAIRQSFSLMVPATLGIVALGAVGLNFVYGRGEFSNYTLLETVKCLWGYGLGLLPATCVMIFSSAFYAKKKFGLPAVISLLSVLLNLVLNSVFVLVWKQGAASVAFATSISSYFNMLLLGYFLLKNTSHLFNKETLISFVKVTFLSFCSAFIALVGAKFLSDPSFNMVFGGEGVLSFPREFLTQTRHLGVMSSLFFLSLFGGAYLIGAKEIFHLFSRHKKTADS